VWGKALVDQFSAMTKIGVAETDINWATVTRPGVSTNAGYQVFYLNDALHGTAPIYFRIDFGTAGTATWARIQLTVGTSTNGTGTIGGTALTATNTSACGAIATSTTTAAPSYLSVQEGFIGFVMWSDHVTTGQGQLGFCIARTCDATGAIDTTGALVVGHAITNGTTQACNIQNLRFAATAAAYVRAATYTCINIPHSETQTFIGGVPQAYLAWSSTPAMAPLYQLCGVYNPEIPKMSTFKATLVGSTQRTYLNIGQNLGAAVGSTSVQSWGLGILWE
jgi:hypothetical protein